MKQCLSVRLSLQVTVIIFALVIHAFSHAQFYFDVLRSISALSMLQEMLLCVPIELCG